MERDLHGNKYSQNNQIYMKFFTNTYKCVLIDTKTNTNTIELANIENIIIFIFKLILKYTKISIQSQSNKQIQIHKDKCHNKH